MKGLCKIIGFGLVTIGCMMANSIFADEPSTPITETDKIIVTATRTPKPLKDVPGAVSVINRNDMLSKNTLDLADTLEDIIGLRIRRYGALGSSSSVNIRGLYSQHILVMVDDRIINSPSMGSADFSSLSVDNVERVEVIRGPFSALYGANAVGGVVNIITKPVPKEPLKNISTLYGSYQTSINTIESGMSDKQGGYLFNSNYKTSQGHRDNSEHHSTNTTLRLNYQDESSINFTVDTGYFTEKTRTPGARPSADPAKRTASQLAIGNDEVSSLVDFDQKESSYLNTLFASGDLKLHLSFNKKDDVNHREWMSSGKRISQDSNYQTTVSALEVLQSFSLSNHQLMIGATIETNQFNTLSKDLDVASSTVTTREWDAERTTYSGFIQDEIKFSELILTLGGRFDNPRDFDSQFSAKGNILYQVTPSMTVRGSYGSSYRAPSLNDLYWPKDDFAEGNLNLTPEKGKSAEIGVDYTVFSLGDDKEITAGINIFSQDIDQMIAWAPRGSRWTPSNLNQVKINGLEFQNHFNLIKDVSFGLNYTLLDATQQNQEITDAALNTMETRTRRLASVPARKLDLSTGVKDVFSIEKLLVNLAVQYISETSQYYSDYSAWPFVTTLEKSLPGYWLVNLKTRYSIKNTDIFLGVDNLTDKKYANQFGSSIYDRDYPMPGRAITTGVTMRF